MTRDERFGGMIQRLIAGFILLWAFGFALFAIDLPHGSGGDGDTDGIVVLTGGPGRVQRGVALLAAGKARRMFVSGVDKRVTRDALARTYSLGPAVLARTDLGHFAVDTRSNAQETARWIAAHHYRSIRLVTTDWHMRRARFELRQVLSGVRVVPDAVPSEPHLMALLREYNKYLLRRGAALVGA